MRKKKSISRNIRSRIENSSDKVWSLKDFQDLPIQTVARTLSRLNKEGFIQRVGKGLYYKPRATVFGKSSPNFNTLNRDFLKQRGVFLSGISASNFLGFTTQNAARTEVATSGSSLPRLFIGKDTIVHTRRPESWKKLTYKDAAILDFLRNYGKTSDFTSNETIDRLIDILSEPGQFERLLKVAPSEPPRVRAILGAIGQQIGYQEKALQRLKKSLNPLSRFNFGILSHLKYANEWQAKWNQKNEAF